MEAELQTVESLAGQTGAPAWPLIPVDELLLSKSVAAQEGALVVSGFRAGVRAVIDACVRTATTIERFNDEPSAIDEFTSALVEGNLISRSEARLGLASPKLSKFRAIGENAEMLCHEQVFRYLPPGYTLIYQVTVLYSLLGGDEAHRFEQLVRELDALSPLSRERLIARTEEIKRAKKGASTLPFALDAEDRHAASDVDPIENLGADYKLVLLTPDHPRDFWRLSEDYAAEPKFLRLGSELLAEDAVAIVIGQLADIPLIENKLLPILRFPYLSQVCLVRMPTHADVTDAEVLIVAHRTQTTITADFTWLADSEKLDAKALVERLLPDAGKKLHLFAPDGSDESSDGWLSIIGKANWGQSDE
jgi:hypothetical protein